VVAQKIERREIVLPADEKLVAQLTSRRKLYDSKGRERLESKADMRSVWIGRRRLLQISAWWWFLEPQRASS